MKLFISEIEIWSEMSDWKILYFNVYIIDKLTIK